jgi:hypothetical protein
MDITDADKIARVLIEVQPTAVINAAVASGIELAEADPSDAQATNAAGPAKLAELCAWAMTRNVSDLCVKRVGPKASAVPSAAANMSRATAMTTRSLIASVIFATIACFVSTISRTRRWPAIISRCAFGYYACISWG